MEQKFQHCKTLSADYKLQKKTQPFIFKKSFRDSPEVIEIHRIINFFENSNLGILDYNRLYTMKLLIEQTFAIENYILYQHLLSKGKS